MARYARGRDIVITVTGPDGPVTPFRVNSGTIDYGLEVEEIDLVGGLDTDGFNGHVILSLDANPASRAWFDLIHSSRDRNDGTQTFTIEAEVTLTLPDGNRERTVLDDCYLSADVLNLPASKDRTTQGWTLTSATMSRLTS